MNIARSVGFTPKIKAATDLALLECELSSPSTGVKHIVQGLAPSSSFAEDLERIKQFVAARALGSGGASVEAGTTYGEASSSFGGAPSRMSYSAGVQAKLGNLLSQRKVVSALAALDRIHAIGHTSDQGEDVIQVVINAECPALWGLVLTGRPQSLAASHPSLALVHPSRFAVSIRWEKAIARAQSSSSSSSAVSGIGAIFMGETAIRYTASSTTVLRIANTLRLSDLSIEFSKALNAELGLAAGPIRTMVDFFDKGLDYFVLYANAALPSAGWPDPSALGERLTSCRAALDLYERGDPVRGRVATQLVTALEQDFEAADHRRHVDFETLSASFSPLSFPATQRTLAQCQAGAHALSTLSALMPGMREALGSASESSEPANKVRKLEDVAAVCASRAALNDLALHDKDLKVRIFGKFYIFTGHNNSYVYRAAVKDACIAALKKDGVATAGKAVSLDVMLSPGSSDYRATLATRAGPNTLAAEPSGWEQTRSSYLAGDFAAPPRN